MYKPITTNEFLDDINNELKNNNSKLIIKTSCTDEEDSVGLPCAVRIFNINLVDFDPYFDKEHYGKKDVLLYLNKDLMDLVNKYAIKHYSQKVVFVYGGSAFWVKKEMEEKYKE